MKTTLSKSLQMADFDHGSVFVKTRLQSLACEFSKLLWNHRKMLKGLTHFVILSPGAGTSKGHLTASEVNTAFRPEMPRLPLSAFQHLWTLLNLDTDYTGIIRSKRHKGTPWIWKRMRQEPCKASIWLWQAWLVPCDYWSQGMDIDKTVTNAATFSWRSIRANEGIVFEWKLWII